MMVQIDFSKSTCWPKAQYNYKLTGTPENLQTFFLIKRQVKYFIQPMGCTDTLAAHVIARP